MTDTNKPIAKANIALIYYVFLLLICIIYGVICLLYQPLVYNSEFVIKSWGWLSIFLLLLSTFTFIKRTNSVFNAYIIYVLVAYFYWLGLLFLNALNINIDRTVLSWFDYKALIGPIVYTVLGFGLFQLAALLYTQKNSFITNFSQSEIFTNKRNKSAVLITSVILLLISAPIYYSNLINNAIVSLTSGYGALYNNANDSSSVNNIISSLEIFFIPGLYLFFSVNRKSKIARYFVISLVVINILLSFLTGVRSLALILLISFLWLYHVQVSPFKGKKNLLLVILGIFIMALSVTIIQYRGTSDKTFTEFLNIFFKNIGEENFIITFISELGYSIYPLIETMRLIPENIDFAYGFSYLSSFLAVIPSLLLGGFSFANYAALDVWLMNQLNINYGPGYSLIAETYYNFGWFGLLLMPIWGGILVRIFNNVIISEGKVVRNAYIAILVYYLLMTARSPLLLSVRNIFYGIIIPMVLIKLFELAGGRKR
ncbi:O-antigen polysaccharide polymerase Wzy [Mesobacillus harenae]|uniref:O-antigen polysaccharide polymerase Wzy n=1 Tax=Mesobacillus harenae TaxID=2213203 RepID=UPI00157FC4E1|nr:O-antigen polysaccharide polymerase Wzy [Mesobacillus harenae]